MIELDTIRWRLFKGVQSKVSGYGWDDNYFFFWNICLRECEDSPEWKIVERWKKNLYEFFGVQGS